MTPNRRLIAQAIALFTAQFTAAASAQTTPSSGLSTESPPTAVGAGDPMLKAIPPTRNHVDSWNGVVMLLRAQLPAIRESRALLDRDEAHADASLAPALPSLRAGAELNRQLLSGSGYQFTAEGARTGVTLPDPATTWDAGLTAVVPVFAPRIWEEARAARLAVKAGRFDRQNVERLAQLAAADAVFDCLRARKLAEVTRAALSAVLEASALMQRSRALGYATDIDLLRAEGETESARNLVLAADDAERAAEEALGLALGFAEPVGLGEDADMNGWADQVAHMCPSLQPNARPDVREGATAKEVAERVVRATEYDWFPVISAVSNATYWSTNKFTPNGAHTTWSLGGTLNWTLYDGGLRSSSKAVAHADLAIASAKAKDTSRTAQLEHAIAARQLDAALRKVKISVAASSLTEKAAHLAYVAFVNGGATSFDVIETTRRARDAQIETSIAESAVARGRARLAMLDGGCALSVDSP